MRRDGNLWAEAQSFLDEGKKPKVEVWVVDGRRLHGVVERVEDGWVRFAGGTWINMDMIVTWKLEA
ncbi:hypothetical protein ASC97_32290 [Rhizobium sp. Root1203]|uniref:hypothetical protein n=1 Tax=Rhizobium sp. Root1203 TaxID=1736427 RepID=UPI00070F5A27|nr:hypothetical protein [Rhizobium sp. Root1203]KQV12509.1 hypothetical protein ASC97_32290 [Rhizobium sp. Root1203]